MEIIENRQPDNNRPDKGVNVTRNVYLGILLISTGALWLMYNFDMLGYTVFRVIFSWQMLLVVIGGYLLSVRKRAAGIILITAGIIFGVIRYFDVIIPVDKILLPVIVIAAGIAFLFPSHK